MVDLNFIRGVISILLMLAFIALCIWAFLPSQKKQMDEAARLVLDEDVDKREIEK